MSIWNWKFQDAFERPRLFSELHLAVKPSHVLEGGFLLCMAVQHTPLYMCYVRTGTNYRQRTIGHKQCTIKLHLNEREFEKKSEYYVDKHNSCFFHNKKKSTVFVNLARFIRWFQIIKNWKKADKKVPKWKAHIFVTVFDKRERTLNQEFSFSRLITYVFFILNDRSNQSNS